MSKLQERLKKLRIDAGLSQKKMAELLNVSQVAVTYWENGRREPNSEMIEKIAAFFNVSPAYLMGWEQNISHDEIVEDLKDLDLHMKKAPESTFDLIKAAFILEKLVREKGFIDSDDFSKKSGINANIPIKIDPKMNFTDIEKIPDEEIRKIADYADYILNKHKQEAPETDPGSAETDPKE